MTILLSDAAVSAVPLRENGDGLVELPVQLSPTRARVRIGLGIKLLRAAGSLPVGTRLCVVEGLRPAAAQRAIIAGYSAQLAAAGHEGDTLTRLVSRYVAPLDVAPHVAGAAVDLTLVDENGTELDMGTAIDDTPEASGGRCAFDSPDIGPVAARNRAVLASALSGAGLVNYPTEWWHWSYGDRYWALMTGAPRAIYGPLDEDARA